MIYVILHPYGTPDGFKAIYHGNSQSEAAKRRNTYQERGWGSELYTVRAATFHDAVVRASAEAGRRRG